MILRGVIEYTFGGALCFRGFARIGDLAKISKPKDIYQREVDIERAKEILDFLRNGKYRFFSELTFGLNFVDPNAIFNIERGVIGNFLDGINFQRYKKDYEDYEKSDKFESPLLRRIALQFKDDNKKYLSRIDGNHRLTAVENLEENEISSLNYLVPFCIILQQESDDAERHENAYFHSINSKSVRLTSEENLNSILSANLFSENEIEEILGRNGLLAKSLLEKLDNYTFQGIDHIIKDYRRSFALGCFELFEDENNNDERPTTEDIQKAIQYIDTLYSEENKLKESENLEILLTLIYYKLKGKTIFENFKEWIFGNHIFNLKEIKASSIIKIYNSIHFSRPYKIFVAMPFWSQDIVFEYNKLFKEICNEISNKAKVEIELIPIMNHYGKSKRIDRHIMDKIKESDIFIANITGNNRNVIFEVGYAEACNKHMIILKEESDKKIVPFDMDKLRRISYCKQIYYNDIKTKVSLNIISILKDEYKITID